MKFIHHSTSLGKTLLASAVLAAVPTASSPASAGSPCHWYTAEKIVADCGKPGHQGRIFEPGAGGLAIGCGPASCAGARDKEGCMEFGVGPHSAAPRWAENSDTKMVWTVAADTNAQVGTSGDPGPGTPYDQCLVELRKAAKTLGY